jgi:hypothetical protein
MGSKFLGFRASQEISEETMLGKLINKWKKKGMYQLPIRGGTDNVVRCRCGGVMKERKGKFGIFYGCTNYPKCTQTMNEKEYKKLA